MTVASAIWKPVIERRRGYLRRGWHQFLSESRFRTLLILRDLACSVSPRYHGPTMQWQRGFKRIRLVSTVALIAGVVLLLSVVLTQSLGYAPNPPFAPLYSAFWPLGLMLLVLGALLWVAVWVLSGFLPEVGAPGTGQAAERTRFYR